jgi:hypothetical protein
MFEAIAISVLVVIFLSATAFVAWLNPHQEL